VDDNDQQYIRAAEGWIELGDHLSAFEELEKLGPRQRAHPYVFKLRWHIFNHAGKHEMAFTIAEGLTRLLPDDPEGFVWRSYSARRMPGGGVENALALLLDVIDDFPDEPLLPFNLACYHCQLGQQVEARSWLQIAFEVAERNGVAKIWKLKALKERDLESLWGEMPKG
jgi:tetratricopeptide (TPR) repeat protein